MKIDIESSELDGIKVIKPQVFQDSRGLFMEMYRKDIFMENFLDIDIVQVNFSRSKKNTVRGLHFQWEPPMGKLMTVMSGEAFLVAVDIRPNSKYLGEWYGIKISSEDRKFVWAPAGFARGFAALSDFVDIQYFTTGIYNEDCESGVRWNDPKIDIRWPVQNPELSDKDITAQSLDSWLQTEESKFFNI
jgi:dTDP-4-dehydrorhamnose 3,5-epimerase